MRCDRTAAALAVAAALLAGVPALAASRGPDVIWVDLCDAAHPGRRIPLPLRRDRDAPLGACHAACAVMPDRRAKR
jgi:hypothetical protein